MSSSDFTIKISNLSKCYKIYSKPSDRLKQIALSSIRKLFSLNINDCYREFWALKDISFDVRPGEAVGILGRNGAGKSTLLQLIAGTLTPTSGGIQINGRVAALLELGSGFNVEFTGRENVYLNASIMGLKKSEIDIQFNEIKAFADIGDFMDQPMSSYSSGMIMRLAFAVNTCMRPDILIIDEALAVGDGPFQAKCFRRLRTLLETGTSLLFVSHDIEIIKSLCTNALWIDHGMQKGWGTANDISMGYQKSCWVNNGVSLNSAIKTSSGSEIDTPNIRDLDECLDANIKKESDNISGLVNYGTKQLEVISVKFSKNEDEVPQGFNYGDELNILITCRCNEKINSDFICGILIKDSKGNDVLASNNFDSILHINASIGEVLTISMAISLLLTHRDYSLLLGLIGFKDGQAVNGATYDSENVQIWHVIEDLIYFKVFEHKPVPLNGPVHFPLKLMLGH